MAVVNPIPEAPPRRELTSPDVVRVLDRIRREVEDADLRDGSDERAEFCWFAREYPRCYRFHLDGADFRLESIRDGYESVRLELANSVSASPGGFEYAIANQNVQRIYWDFESFLSEVNVSLDLLARIVGVGYRDHTSPNLNKLCKSQLVGGPVEVLRSARSRWVLRMKAYRDCFIHYTPVDTLLMLQLLQSQDGNFDVRGKLPVNPNVRDILGFRYSRRVELLKYAFTVHRHMTALDRAIAREIWRSYRCGEYPRRTTRLFFLGARGR